MIGYKLVRNNGKAILPPRICSDFEDDIKYEQNKIYRWNGKLVLGFEGYHFSKFIWETLINLRVYDMENFKVLIIDTLDGDIITHGRNCATNILRVIGVVSLETVLKDVEENWKEAFKYIGIRCFAAINCIKSDILVYDRIGFIRKVIAKYETNESILKVLMDDYIIDIRMILCKRGYFLDRYITDPISSIRREAIKNKVRRNLYDRI